MTSKLARYSGISVREKVFGALISKKVEKGLISEFYASSISHLFLSNHLFFQQVDLLWGEGILFVGGK